MTEQQAEWASRGIDITKPSIARAYDVVLHGKDNFEVDRAFVQEITKIVPEIYDVATYNREILGRGVRYIAAQGVRQFLDLGSGLPTVQNTHHVAQSAAPESRVVYVDNDPIVLAHGRALLAENEHTTVIQADIRDPSGSSPTTRCASSSSSTSRWPSCSSASCTTCTTTSARSGSPTP